MGNPDEDEPHADVVFMGGARVGKTALLHRLLQIEPSDALEGRYKPTIEDSFIREFLVGEHCCRLRLVDTAGGYSFPAMQKLWVKRASAFVLVCARDEPGSLEHIRSIMNQITEERGDKKRQPFLVLAVNKCDLHMKHWVVTDDEIESMADEYHIPYDSIVLTSAIIDMGVNKMMKCLWKQNDGVGSQAIKFDLQSKRPPIKRRFSAFAVLFRGSSGANKAALVRTDNQPLERPYNGSLGGETPLIRQRRLTVSSGSPGWLTKQFRKMSIGNKERPRRNSSTVIDMQCNIS